MNKPASELIALADILDRVRDALKKIELASRKDSLTDHERLQSVRTIVCAAISESERPRTAANQPGSERAELPFQDRVRPWMLACFGPAIPFDKTERNHRFLEEAIELVQSLGCTQSEAHQLVDYVYGRPEGEPNQEVGGVMVTLAALCLANDLDMAAAGETELARIWTKVEKIRAKQAAKPKHSPLPEALATPPAQPAPASSEKSVTCERCQGNGEIVTDWNSYLHPANLAAEQASVAECPDCDGEGTVGPSEATHGKPDGAMRSQHDKLHLFLSILDRAGGATSGNDDKWNWINYFCDDAAPLDTFNLASKQGLTRVTHDVDNDNSVVYLTDAGRAFIAALRSPKIAAAETGPGDVLAMKEALSPFAELVPSAFDHSYPDDAEIILYCNGEPHAFLKNIDFRRAKAAFAGTLAPCPFCGGEADFVRKGTARQSCVVACLDCGARLETGEVWTSGRAWNERAALPTPKREAMALESRLEQVAKVMRSARAKNIPMEVWADDLKAVEDAILAVRIDEAAMIEVWHELRKVTIYVDTVIRVWGLDIDSEMSSEPRSLETVQSAFEWLFAVAKDEAAIRKDEREKCAKVADASARLAVEQININNAYYERSGSRDAGANDVCRSHQITAEQITSAIRNRRQAAMKLTEAHTTFLSRFVGRGWLHGVRDDANEQTAIDIGLRRRWLRRELSEVHFTPAGRRALEQSQSQEGK